jgi:predicted RNase H-like HicB family nuclease
VTVNSRMERTLAGVRPLNRQVVLRTADGSRIQDMTVRYKIALHRSDEGVAVSVPGLPGCWSQGKDEAEAIENIRDAIQAYLSVADEQLEGAEVREIEVAI